MPDHNTPSDAVRISGDDIVAEILRGLGSGEFSMGRVRFLPSVFHVYLHPDDYQLLRPLLPAVTEQLRATLRRRMDELNRRSRRPGWTRFVGLDAPEPVEYRIQDSDWTLQFHEDLEERLNRGDLEIDWKYASETRNDLEGEMTRPVRAFQDESTARVEKPEIPRPTAVLRYSAKDGSRQTFVVARDEIAVGRGGAGVWVDLRLDAPLDVSREHCRIRRDASGRYWLRDLSRLGTRVNGTPVPPSLDPNGSGRDLAREVELPEGAVIDLAGVFTLTFSNSGGRERP